MELGRKFPRAGSLQEGISMRKLVDSPKGYLYRQPSRQHGFELGPLHIFFNGECCLVFRWLSPRKQKHGCRGNADVEG